MDDYLLPEFSGFDWSRGNDEKIWLRHRVATSEAEQVFFNIPHLIMADTGHSTQEDRFHLLGKSDAGRGLMVVFTMRRDKVRVISARDMSRRERKVYDEL